MNIIQLIFVVSELQYVPFVVRNGICKCYFDYPYSLIKDVENDRMMVRSDECPKRLFAV
jgi:hypothetical protein